MLAGGLGRRIGGGKPTTELCGRPLISYPLAAARRAGMEPLVIAKPATDLDDVEAEIVREPAEPSHPLVGIATALALVGAPIVVCPCDLPLIEPATLAYLAGLEVARAPRLIESSRGPEPLVGIYPPSAGAMLGRLAAGGRPSLDVVDLLGAVSVPLAASGAAEHALLNVNDPDSLEAAARLLRG